MYLPRPGSGGVSVIGLILQRLDYQINVQINGFNDLEVTLIWSFPADFSGSDGLNNKIKTKESVSKTRFFSRMR